MPRSLPAASALCVIFAGACSAAPPPPPPPVVAKTAPPSAPPLHPARWLVSRDRPTSDTPVAGGTLELVGGRRLLIAADGAGRWQTVDLPVPLNEVVSVPTAGGPRLVGRAGGVVYRFDDPLGAGTPLLPGDFMASRIRVMPGLVVVWDATPFSLPRFLSVETGKESTPAALPDFPLKDVFFEDDLHGAALLALWGVSVTHDGGATWQRPRTAGPAGGVLDAPDLDAVDILEGKLLAPTPPQEAAPTPTPAPSGPPAAGPQPGATLPLADAFGRDLLAAAALIGVAAPDGGAWIPWADLVVHLDLRATTATVAARIPTGNAQHAVWCEILRAGSDIWVGCRPRVLQSKLSTVLRGRVEDGKLLLAKPERLGLEATELHVSPSGGVLAFGETGTSVRQPNGDWLPYPAPVTPWPPAILARSAGALADGRVAFLENPPRVVLVTPASGAKEALPPLHLAALSVTGPIEEDAAHVLHFVAEDEQGLVAVGQPLGGGEARVVRVPGAFAARLHGGHAVALSKHGVLTSTDSGETWSEVPAPPSLLATLAKPEAIPFLEGDANAVQMQRPSAPDEKRAFAVGEIGALVGDHLRIGWGAAEPAPAAPPAAPVASAGTAPPPTGKLHALSCRGGGAAAGALSPGDTTWSNLKKVKRLPDMPEDAPVVREQAVFSSADPRDIARAAEHEGGPVNPFAAAVVFLEGQPPSPVPWAASRYRWLIRWLDPAEIGSRPRTWQGEAPSFEGSPGVALTFAHPAPGENVLMPALLEGSGVAGFTARDGRAIFYVGGHLPFEPGHGDYGGVLVRLGANGKGELFPVIPEVEVTAPWLREATFGSGPGAPIAGIWGGFLFNELFVWLEGKRMQPIARMPNLVLASPAQIIVGEPTPFGVPLLALHGSFQRLGVVPIPKTTPAELPLLDGAGWKRLAVAVVPERLPPCDAKAQGMTFTLRATKPPVRVLLDGNELAATSAMFDVRVNEQSACIARASLALEAKGGSTPIFVRADVAGHRAEGGALDGPTGAVRKLACEWVEEEKR